MTPRPGKAPSSTDFARQVRERHASLQPTKKFKSSAPKGSKFGAGYTDRAKARQDAEHDEDDKAERIKALEEQVKLGQLAQETFEALRDKITGGDASSTHLVKGLDRQLLERVRRGEDVLGLGGPKSEGQDPPPDVDDELEKLGEQDIAAVKREKAEKKGTKAPAPVAGVKRSRDEIMAELKAQRKAAAEAKAAAAPALDSRWKRVGDKDRPSIEVDHKGREVLITVDENGVTKRKIRKAAPEEKKASMDMPDVSKPILGADHVFETQPKQQEDDDDEDIFEGAGTEYDPLGTANDDDSDDDDGSDAEEGKRGTPPTRDKPVSPAKPYLPDPQDAEHDAGQLNKTPRSYFNDNKKDEASAEQDRFKGIENVLKKAAKIDDETLTKADGDPLENEEDRAARLAKRAKMLANQDRDMEDMDMGFGSSRFEDEDESSGKKAFSEWKGVAAGENGWFEDERDEGKKKRKPKKRKGDANNAADVMRVIEGRKTAGSK